MFDKEIEFSSHEDYFAQKEDYPIPIKLNIPEWYKKLDHTLENKTVKIGQLYGKIEATSIYLNSSTEYKTRMFSKNKITNYFEKL